MPWKKSEHWFEVNYIDENGKRIQAIIRGKKEAKRCHLQHPGSTLRSYYDY